MDAVPIRTDEPAAFRLFQVTAGPGTEVEYTAGTTLGATELHQHLTALAPDAAEPALAHLVARILEASSGTECADLFLPLLAHRERRSGEWVDAARAFVLAPETVVIATTDPDAVGHRGGYAESVLALGALGAPAPPLRFYLHNSQAEAAEAAQLGARYGLAEAISTWAEEAGVTEQPLQAEVILSLPAEYMRSWMELGEERSKTFKRSFSRVSAAMQQVLRAWTRFTWPMDVERWNNLPHSRAMLLYSRSHPLVGMARPDMTYDPLSAKSMASLYESAGIRLFSRDLDQIHGRLTRAARAELARAYRSLHAREIMDAAKKEGKIIKRLVAMEHYLINDAMNFGAACHAVATGQPIKGEAAVPNLAAAADNLLHSWRSRLRRGLLPDWSNQMAVLLLIESTRALRLESAQPVAIDVQFRLLPAASDGPAQVFAARF